MYVFKKEYKQLLIDTIVNSRAWIGEACCAVVAAHTLLQWRGLAAGGQRGTETKCQRRGGKAVARSLAVQHGLQFISRVSAYFKQPLLP